MATHNYTLLGSLVASGLVAGVVILAISRHYTKQATRDLKRTMHSLVLTSRPESVTHIGKRPEGYDAAAIASQLPPAKSGKAKATDLASRLFQAGYFYRSDLVRFKKRVAISFAVMTILAVGLVVLPASPAFTPLLRLTVALILLFIGYAAPMTFLDRKIAERSDEISYHLPLTIEQISIGVSSGLDIWPCIANLITMTVKRNTVTPIVELFILADKLIRAGMSVAEALRSIGNDCGNTNLKHAFSFLAQVAQHGGDVSKNLQEMADATMLIRATDVEAKIHTLPVKATGPLCLVFAGFFGIMLSGMLVQMLNAFPKDGQTASESQTPSHYVTFTV